MNKYPDNITKEQLHAILEDVYNKLPDPAGRTFKMQWCNQAAYDMFKKAIKEEAVKKLKEDE